MSFEKFYMKNHKKLLIIPILILVISIIVLLAQYSINGYILDKDVSLKGGVSSTIYVQEDINIESIESKFLEQYPGSDVSIRKLTNFGTSQKTGIIIEVTEVTADQVRTFVQETFNTENYSIQEIGEGLGQSFFKEMIYAIIFAFILMGIVVLITFRKLIPSFAVIFSAILDIVVTLAIISLLNIKISSAGIAAFLMVLGYSIDTDILLTTRILKRKIGTIFERLKGAFKTGIVMTTTTIAALGVAYLATNSTILKQMFGIIIIALVVDIISTWIMNAGLIIQYAKKNENK
jgi:preprotein translocase subunit SecF